MLKSGEIILDSYLLFKKFFLEIPKSITPFLCSKFLVFFPTNPFAPVTAIRNSLDLIILEIRVNTQNKSISVWPNNRNQKKSLELGSQQEQLLLLHQRLQY